MKLGICQACEQPGVLRDLLWPGCQVIRDANLIKNELEGIRKFKRSYDAVMANLRKVEKAINRVMRQREAGSRNKPPPEAFPAK